MMPIFKMVLDLRSDKQSCNTAPVYRSVQQCKFFCVLVVIGVVGIGVLDRISNCCHRGGFIQSLFHNSPQRQYTFHVIRLVHLTSQGTHVPVDQPITLFLTKHTDMLLQAKFNRGQLFAFIKKLHS